MKDKESGYPLSFILTEWEYAGGLALELGCTASGGYLSSAKERYPPEADTPI